MSDHQVKHLIYGQDPNESWCSFGRLDDNVEDVERTTCTACLEALVSGSDRARDRLAVISKELAR